MTLSQIFERAAERIADGRSTVCCYAIDDAVSNAWLRRTMRRWFEMLYPASDRDSEALWWGINYKEENQTARVLALLLAAEFYRKPKRKRKRK